MMQWFDRRSPHPWRASLLLAALTILPASPLAAQVPVESAGGTRALGMGGAFTAVADDATAAWWNPAGLVDSARRCGARRRYRGRRRRRRPPLDGRGAWRAQPFSIAVAFPMLGVSFNRLTGQEIRQSSTGPAGPGRQDPAAVPQARSFSLSSVGVSLVQSVGDHLVVGSTIRLLRGGSAVAARRSGATVDEALDAVGALDTTDRTVADVDLAAMAFVGPVRLAVAGRNLGGHRFEAGPDDEDPVPPGADGARRGRGRSGCTVGPAGVDAGARCRPDDDPRGRRGTPVAGGRRRAVAGAGAQGRRCGRAGACRPSETCGQGSARGPAWR